MAVSRPAAGQCQILTLSRADLAGWAGKEAADYSGSPAQDKPWAAVPPIAGQAASQMLSQRDRAGSARWVDRFTLLFCLVFYRGVCRSPSIRDATNSASRRRGR